MSLHALTGIATAHTMKMKICIVGVELLALVDSGSTNTFAQSDVAQRLGLDIKHRPGLSIKVANGYHVTSPGMSAVTPVDIQGELFHLECYALPLDGFDVVLGVQWLKTLGPIIWDFVALSMAFWRDSRPVHWHGVGGTPMQLSALTATCDVMAVLRADYQDIFIEPRGLPPPRRQDHRIHLLPGMAPVAVRPYRYPQLLKDEIERQCEDMLAQGIICETTSPFSSPVLLVKKADGS